MVIFVRSTQINHGQHHENERLQRDDQQVEQHPAEAERRAARVVDALSRLVAVKDPANAVWRNEYDVVGRLTATVDPTGVRREQGVSAHGMRRTLTDGAAGTVIGVSRQASRGGVHNRVVVRGQDQDGRKTWPVNRYFIEGERRTDWYVQGVLKYHRTIGTTLNALIGAGFSLRHVEEFSPTREQIRAMPELADELERPMMLLVSAQR